MKRLSQTGDKTMSRLIAMVAMAVVVYVGLQWLADNVIYEILASTGMAGYTGSITGVIAFAIMALLMSVVCFKS